MIRPQKHKHTFRFWVWHRGGWVKLSIIQGDQVQTYKGWDNGEGWSYEASTYSIAIVGRKKCLVQSWEHGGSDCDGKHEEYGTRMCPVSELRALDANEDYIARGRMSAGREMMVKDAYYWEGRPIQHPNFEKYGKTRVFDQFAQMMGY